MVNVNFGNQQNPKILEVSVSVAEISVIRVPRVLCLWDAPLGRDAQYDPKLLYSLSMRTTQWKIDEKGYSSSQSLEVHQVKEGRLDTSAFQCIYNVLSS